MAFTVSMPQPSNHTYHVTFRCEGLHGALQDFKMPQWSPGYYGIGDYARNVSNFHAIDRAGHELAWEKVTKNTWRVVADNAPVIVLEYDVFGNTSFAANNYLGEDRGYLSPSGLFVNLVGYLQQPVTVTIRRPANWKRISTGLEAVNGQGDTFEGPDF
jgi:predicted metalloprotease with PDZ domain